jgi:hypothetical protein
MLNKEEFAERFPECTSLDESYQIYKDLSQPIHVDAAKEILNSEDERLRFLRNCLCSNHLVEVSPQEMAHLLEVLRFIVESN